MRMNPFTALFGPPAKGRLGHVRLILEWLEGRDLPSGITLVTNAGADPIPQIARAEYVRDTDRLTRTDVIELFDRAAGLDQEIFATGAPFGQLDALVQKWFYGAGPSEINIEDVLDKPAMGSLFGPNGPQASDMVEKAYAQLADEGQLLGSHIYLVTDSDTVHDTFTLTNPYLGDLAENADAAAVVAPEASVAWRIATRNVL
jgi:hypothetical protein